MHFLSLEKGYTHINKNYLPSPVDSILEAVLTVSPNRQYRGMVRPTTPATHGPAARVKTFLKLSSQSSIKCETITS